MIISTYVKNYFLDFLMRLSHLNSNKYKSSNKDFWWGKISQVLTAYKEEIQEKLQNYECDD